MENRNNFFPPTPFSVSTECMLICSRIKREKTEGTKCHAKTMMSIKSDKSVKEIPRMCRLGRTLGD